MKVSLLGLQARRFTMQLVVCWILRVDVSTIAKCLNWGFEFRL